MSNALEIDPTLGVDLGDADVWARQIINSGEKAGKGVPERVDLESAITDIRITDTIKGSSTIVLSVSDPEWLLMDSGFFDAQKDGELDAVDVNYPDGSRLWWRLSQVGVNLSGKGGVLELTFLERAAVYMMRHHGPLKTSRAKKTRAEFVAFPCSKVKAGGGIDFHSRELHVKQGQAPEPKSERRRRKGKEPGIAGGSGLTIKGVEATKQQLEHVEVALDVAHDWPQKVPRLAVLAMLCAGIGESDFTDVTNSIGAVGVFQAYSDAAFFRGMGPKERTAAEAHWFLKGGHGYGSGGAIYLAKHSIGMDPGEIATRVEISGKDGSFYGKYKPEAEKLLEAYGSGGFGGSGGPGTYRKQYNFKVGPHQNFWDAAGQLADEVRWAFFMDGDDAYFDAETTLIRQKPVAVIERGHPAVVRFECNWDMRQIATEATLELICDPFEFRAGEVLKLEGFGPASTGSTAKLPGRWLISDVDRPRFSLVSTFTLKQPEKERKEPRSELVTRREEADEAGGPIAGSPKDVIDNVVLPIGRAHGAHAPDGSALTPRSVELANARHGPTTSGSRSDHQGPPSAAWAADMGIGSDLKKGDELCAALAKRFGFTGGHPRGSGSFVRVIRDGYSFQLLWRVPDHFDHVHFGVQAHGGSYDVPVPRG